MVRSSVVRTHFQSSIAEGGTRDRFLVVLDVASRPELNSAFVPISRSPNLTLHQV